MYFLCILIVLGQSRNQNQVKVIEDLKSHSEPFVYDHNKKLNQKLELPNYPDDQIPCNQTRVCELCQTDIAFHLNKDNYRLIGLHYGFKEEFRDLFETFRNLNQSQVFVAFKYKKAEICYEIQSISKQVTHILNILVDLNGFLVNLGNSPLLLQFHFLIPQIVQFKSILLLCQHSQDDWNFTIPSLQFESDCVSQYFDCQSFHYNQHTSELVIKGFLESNQQTQFILQIDNQNRIITLSDELEIKHNLLDLFLINNIFEPPQEYKSIQYQTHANQDSYEFSVDFIF